MKKWYKSKTVLIAILQGLAGSLMVIAPQLESGIALDSVGYTLIVKSLIDVWIRTITNTAIV